MTPRKIISFRPMTGGLDEAAFQDILWPCNCFTASIPHRGKNRLNIFEETILGLSAAGTGNTADLAEISCLNKDLVLFIQNRLALLGFLDSRNEITDEGKNILAQKESDEEEDYVAVKFFMDPLNDRLLPYVHFGALESKTLVDEDNNRIRFKIRPTDDRIINASKINRHGKTRSPTPREVIKAVRDFRKRYRRYAAFSGNAGAFRPSISKESSIYINPEAEQVFLHCHAFIQESNPDMLVVNDGFGFGYCDFFADYLMKTNWTGFIKLKQGARIDSPDTAEKKEENHSGRIHRIAYLINKSRKALEKSKNQKVSGRAGEKKIEEELANALTNIYEALERTLTQVVFDNPVSEWDEFYSSRSFEENKKNLVEFAQKIGLIVNERNESILYVKPGAIRALSIEKTDMQASLALAITGAANSGNHPLNRLASKYPQILSMIKDIKSERDQIQHGKTEGRRLQEKVELYLEKTEAVIALLLPNISRQFESNAQAEGIDTVDMDIERINQQRLKASLELDNFFGISVMHQLDSDLKELLISVSIAAINKSAGNVKRGINNLASALQIVYHEAMLSVNILNYPSGGEPQSGNIKAIALGKAVGNKFAPNIQDIPAVISSVDERKLAGISWRESYSLQANFIGFIYFCENEKLKSIHDKYPKLLDLTAKLTDLRGHGNTDFSLMGPEDKIVDMFLDIKEEVFKAIKTILEVM